jgi:hypothetical protein
VGDVRDRRPQPSTDLIDARSISATCLLGTHTSSVRTGPSRSIAG